MKKIILKSMVLSIVLLTIVVPFSCSKEMDHTSGLVLTDDDWITNSYRKLFFDFHTQRTAVDVAKGFDASGWADELVKNNVQAVSIHSSCEFGWRMDTWFLLFRNYIFTPLH